jgi:hypothetical protein
MSVDKTLTDIYRREPLIEKYEVENILPGHFDDKYPNLVKFLQEYHRSLEQNDNPVSSIKQLLEARDITQTKTEFLSFISSELLLGKPYFETFNDKRSALQYSNLLYRSKGTEFSIKQFFRIFYNLDIDVDYGREQVFYIGDPKEETLDYVGNGSTTGVNWSFTYENATVLVYLEDDSGTLHQLREGTDFSIDYYNKVIVTKSSDTPQTYEQFDPTSDLTFSYFYANGWVAPGKRLRIVSQRRVQTAIGADVTDKRITNDKFYQLYGLLISTPISVAIWKSAYKTFVHPAGMFLSGQVDITSVAELNIGLQPPALIQPPPPILIEQQANIMMKQSTRGLMTTNVTEIGPGPNGYRVVSRPNDMFHPRTVENWHLQYGSMADADDINSRTMDDTYADLSNNFNLMDEDLWHSDYLHPIDSDGAGNRTPIWGYNEANVVQYDSDYPHGPEYTV